ncbi:MAG: hypothetical protein JNL70_23725 [Saprospiraceae bacterium]|nr:hypothetical protein [Saprospiraceae bacterium]
MVIETFGIQYFGSFLSVYNAAYSSGVDFLAEVLIFYKFERSPNLQKIKTSAISLFFGGEAAVFQLKYVS